jgi:hypothetical protein
MSNTKTNSVEVARSLLPFASALRLKPLVRTSSVLPSGLTAVVSAWPTVSSGAAATCGLRAWNIEPGAAVGLIVCPVGIAMESAAGAAPA